MGYGLEVRSIVVQLPAGVRDSVSSSTLHTGCGAHPDYNSMVQGAQPRVMRQRGEADHSPPPTAKVRMSKATPPLLNGGGA
jgi:hypothetical protein